MEKLWEWRCGQVLLGVAAASWAAASVLPPLQVEAAPVLLAHCPAHEGVEVGDLLLADKAMAGDVNHVSIQQGSHAAAQSGVRELHQHLQYRWVGTTFWGINNRGVRLRKSGGSAHLQALLQHVAEG